MGTVSRDRTRQAVWVQPLDEAACWARISRADEGRLQIRTGSGDRSVVTRFQPLLTGTVMGIALAIPSFSEVFQYAVGRQVVLEIDGVDDDGGYWVVRIVGVARVPVEGLVSSTPADKAGNASSGQRWRYLHLAASHVGGSVAQPCATRPGVGDD